MRVVVAGSPDVAVTTLEALLASPDEIDVVGVITQPPRPVGRKKVLTETPLARAAAAHGLHCVTPQDASELESALRLFDADVAVAVAYGRLIGEQARSIPRLGWWNVHYSLLPKYRGATPVQHALLHGDRRTGVTIFQIDEGLDTGPILATAEYAIEPFVHAGELLAQLARVGAELLRETLVGARNNSLSVSPQEGEPSFAPKLDREDGRLDFTQPVHAVFRRWQAVTPEPGAFTAIRPKDTVLAIIRARPAPDVVDLSPGEVRAVSGRVLIGCGRGALEVTEVQPSGKKPMTAADWLRGAGADVICGP